MHKQMKMITKKNRTRRAFHALAAVELASTGIAHAGAQDDAKGLVVGSSLQMLNY